MATPRRSPRRSSRANLKPPSDPSNTNQPPSGALQQRTENPLIDLAGDVDPATLLQSGAAFPSGQPPSKVSIPIEHPPQRIIVTNPVIDDGDIKMDDLIGEPVQLTDRIPKKNCPSSTSGLSDSGAQPINSRKRKLDSQPIRSQDGAAPLQNIVSNHNGRFVQGPQVPAEHPQNGQFNLHQQMAIRKMMETASAQGFAHGHSAGRSQAIQESAPAHRPQAQAFRSPPNKRSRVILGAISNPSNSQLTEARNQPNFEAQLVDESANRIVHDFRDQNQQTEFAALMRALGSAVVDGKVTTKNRYVSFDSECGLMRRSDREATRHLFVIGDFVAKHLGQLYPDIVGSVMTKLASRGSAGLTRENCFKSTFFDPRVTGFPNLLLHMVLEYGAAAMEHSKQFTPIEILSCTIKCQREINKLCLRYGLDTQILVLQRFGDEVVAQVGNTKILESLRSVINEVTIRAVMVKGFDTVTWNGFIGAYPNNNRGRSAGSNNGQSRPNPNRRGFGNQKRTAGGTNKPKPDWCNPDSPNFVPKNYCHRHHVTKDCPFTAEQCRFKHSNWTADEERIARERLRRRN